MKVKRLLFITLLLIGNVAAQARDSHRIITFEELPAKAQEFVNAYFSDHSVSFVRMETEITKTEYTVRFTNGMEIEFTGNGDWDEVESHHECLPTGYLLNEILDFLNRNHPDCCLHEVKKKRHKIEAELSNGLEIIFNKNGEFLRYDD